MDEQPGIPRAITLFWGTEDKGTQRRGPRPGLSLDKIVAAAVEIADAEGLAPLSMARVAERLGFTTMSLYRHVRSKEDLLLHMFQTVSSGAPDVPDDGSVEWRPALEDWARRNYAGYRAHPWIIQIVNAGPPMTPSQLSWMEAVLRSLVGTGLAEPVKMGILLTLTAYVHGQATFSVDLADTTSDGDMAAYGAMFGRLIDPDRHRALGRAVASGVFAAEDDYMGEFEFGLTCILDGVAAAIAAASPDQASRPDGTVRSTPG